MRGSQPVITISNSDEAALRIIVRQQRSEIERLKDAIRRLADQDATLSVCGGNVTVQVDATLTDAEREAIRFAAVLYGQGGREADAETLRGLLERTK
jgi:hypothetical protein